jgi:hypothetical protein
VCAPGRSRLPNTEVLVGGAVSLLSSRRVTIMCRVNRAARTARVAAVVPLFLVLLIVAGGCGTSRGEGFAIYLPAAEIPVSQLPILSHIEPADTPLVSGADIVSYSKETHQIELTAVAFNRLAELEVPVSGRAFVVCVGRQPVYTAAFFTPISSVSFDGVVIMKPLDAKATAAGRHTVQLQLGYPGPDFFSGKDPRADPEIIESLRQAGKLHLGSGAGILDQVFTRKNSEVLWTNSSLSMVTKPAASMDSRNPPTVQRHT